MKVLAVGDIHTKLWIIRAVEKVIHDYDAVVFVGDYADDWNSGPLQTIATWEALQKFQAKYPTRVFCVIGNHDYIYVNRTPTTASGYNAITQTLINAPENVHIHRWISSLPATLKFDSVWYSHAGITDTWSGIESISDMWSDDSPIWARPNYNNYTLSPQVFGHTPSRTCHRVTKNIWCIDTFSTYPDGTPVGDYSVLEVTDGKQFKKIKLETNNDNNNTTNGIEI